MVRFPRHVEPLVGEVCDARSKREAEQVAQAEDVIGEAGGVGEMLFDAQLGFVIEQAVENMGGVANGRVDDLGVEGRVLIGDVRVEEHAGIVAVLGVAVSGGLIVTAGAEPLRVGGRRCAPRAAAHRATLRRQNPGPAQGRSEQQ